MRTDTSHLVALHESRDRENARLAAATTEKERIFRLRCIAMKNKEIDAEYKFLGMNPVEDTCNLSDDDLLAELL